MDNTSAWQRAIKDLADDNHVTRAEFKEIARWFPTRKMLCNHARGLIEVLTDDEKARAIPNGPCVPPATILHFVI
ncbi:hypothetical protein ZWY2020_056066 [Hordeum vulgare]|nr:hypothetical protein ZWY2020_056066 [Hordeum vulgare]